MKVFFRPYLIFVLLSVSMILTAGCRNAGVISKKDMISILYDMYMIDEYVSSNQDVRAAADSMAVYETLLERYGYTRDRYEASVRYYVSHNDDMLEIVKAVKARMESRIAELSEDENQTVAREENASDMDSDGGEKKITEGKEKEEGNEI